MKQLILILLVLVLPIPAYSGTGNVWLQLSFRETLFTGELWNYIPDANLQRTGSGGIGFHFRAAMEFVQGTSFGISFEYLQIEESNVLTGAFTIPLTAQAMPLLFSYRQYSGSLYMIAEAGICFWNGDKGGIDKAVAIGGGYTLPMTSWLNLEFSLRLLAIFSDNLIAPLTLSIGTSCVL